MGLKCYLLNIHFKSKKELFLADSKYEQNLSKKLVGKGCSKIHASNDADVLIVKTTVVSAVNNPFLAKMLIC